MIHSCSDMNIGPPHGEWIFSLASDGSTPGLLSDLQLELILLSKAEVPSVTLRTDIWVIPFVAG